MFSGAQLTLNVMSDDFVDVILGAISALDPYRETFRIETDDVSTLIVGPPELLFPAMCDLFVTAAKSGKHCVLSATVSRGCPGEPDADICTPVGDGIAQGSLEERMEAARQAVSEARQTGQTVVSQFSLYPLGSGHHMDEIYGCIDFLKTSGVFDRAKNFCTKLRGDAGPVFATLAEAFLRFGAPEGHVALDLKVSANSPSAAG